MSILTAHHPWPVSESSWDYGAAQLLELLRHRDTALTLQQMRDHGIEMAAQAIYGLQLAGHVIDRVPGGDGGQLGGYRLRTVEPQPDGPDSTFVPGSEPLQTIDQGDGR